MPLIGTAGHVDHGKSTLVLRLTGRDPDRWAEEKRRGLTIDLGFAWATLPDGTNVSFVDVPGHERYLKNMLAGIEAIDVALFVVAADEGWMPQSEEHLAVLDLLGVGSGVVALTKADLVDEDMIELAQLEVEERLSASSLDGADIIPVSGVTGSGMDRLVASLQSLVAGVTPRDIGQPRLWVDRSFSASGAGTIVTGTLLDGSFEVEDRVTVYPSGATGRIRGMQSHELSETHLTPGRRVALNLGGIDRDAVGRGDMVGFDGAWDLSTRFTALVRAARYVEELERRGAYQLHIGTAVRRVEIVGIDGGLAVLRTTEPIPIAVGDRFIIRDTGRKLVIGGGRILDPAPGATKQALVDSARIDPDAGSDQIATSLLFIRGQDEVARISAHSLGGQPQGAHVTAGLYLAHAVVERLSSEATRLVGEEHRAYPLREGLPLATLAERLGVPVAVTEMAVERSSSLTRLGPDVAMTTHQIAVDSADLATWERARASLDDGLDVPAISELGIDPELLHYLIRSGDLVRVSDDLVFLPEQVEVIKGSLAAMDDGFTVAEFRDAIGLSRRYVVPILEWADKKGLTARRGDTRVAR